MQIQNHQICAKIAHSLVHKEKEASFSRYGPKGAEYFIIRTLPIIASVYGERGTLAVGVYTYFRWVDDNIDLNSIISVGEKLSFLDRQRELVRGEKIKDPHPIEKMYLELPWHTVEKHKQTLNNHLLTLIGTIEDDTLCLGAYPRTQDEIKEHNTRTFLACAESVNIVLNSKKLKPNDDFLELLNNCMTIGSLKDFEEDLERGMLQVGFDPKEVETIQDMPTQEERVAETLHIYNNERFKLEKAINLKRVWERRNQFAHLNMPFWQKALCLAYMHRACFKTQLKVKYPSQKVVKNIKKAGLMAKTRRLIVQNR